jgi:predicted phosphate transport protein (TIGR00153 family)
VRLAILPKSTGFYDLFERAGQNALATARMVERRFAEWPSPSSTQDDVKALEHVGDDLTGEIIQLLNTQYVTPFDREDIYELATRLDDVVDHMEHASDLLGLYGVETPTRHSFEQCRILAAACEAMAAALGGLRSRGGAETALVEVKRFEDEADRVVRDAIASLFHSPGIDPLLVIRWKDIYDALEDAVDACETVANVIGNVVVKNA